MAKVRFNIPEDATDEEALAIIQEAARKAKLTEESSADEESDGVDLGAEGDLPDDEAEAGSEFL